MLKQVPVSELVPGMKVTQVITQSGPVKIRKVGFIRSPDMIKGLKEMGVTLVEVDFDQSLNVDLESDESDTNEVVALDETENTTTATQRLVMSNRQISDVDRQLSQQFYRSSFMPAVDQMPSKWTIYGKPYAILLVFVVLGILIGSVSSYTILAISNNSNLSLAKWLDTSIGSTPDSAKSPSDVQSNLNEVTSQGTSTVDNNVDVKSQKQNDKSETIDPINQATQERAEDSAENIVSNEATGVMQVKTSTTQKKEEPPVQRQLVNGVLLEEGQKLLGYQGTEDDVDESPKSEIPKTISNKQSNNSDSNTDKPLNSALYRRIQQVAKDVDDQPSLPNPQLVKVTDLNDLPRIDQLSAALLTQMPSMSFSAHMYASNPQDRWVRVNSKRVGEGDIIANNVMLKRIESEKVVLEYKGTEFTMNALSDW